jgi:NAD(P)-dependent dehydrogenase (short-subunit alcohol dehydrogenase family)
MQTLGRKTLFITGGGGGIGLALAQACAREGMRIALADIDQGRLDRAAASLRASGARAATFILDVTDFDAWGRTVAKAEDALGPISLLCNNAGIGAASALAEDDPQRWRHVLEVNALGPFYGCRTVLPNMQSRGEEAHIINIASLSGLRSNAGMSSYDASKHALVGMTDSLRAELSGTNVGLTLVYPGMVRTDFVANSSQVISARTNSETTPLAEGVAALQMHGMDPHKIAERVVRAIKTNEYHVFTHADWKPAIAQVFQDRLDAFGENADPAYCEDVAGLLATVAASRKD